MIEINKTNYMRLFVIGRNPSEADIVISNDFVSNYHAELIQLDNGEMFLVDKSTNGTFLKGNRLTPGKEIQVYRGDNIMFADAPLDWSRIPMPAAQTDVKKSLGIGSHYHNAIVVNGPNVSRFHATLKQKKDGKWYICDHSKNGTSVNGARIPKDKDTLLKRGDAISCAGAFVKNPYGGISMGIIGGIAAAVVACVLIGVMLPKMITWQGPKVSKTYSSSVALMACSYHFEVSCGTLDLTDLPDPDSWNPAKRRFEKNMYTSFVIYGTSIMPFDPVEGNGISYTATGFFVGEDGYVATNRHVALPWETDMFSASTNTTILVAAENYYREKLTDLYENFSYSPALQYISQIKVTGVLDEAIVVPNSMYVDEKNMLNCTFVDAGKSDDEDVALFRVRSKLPESVHPVPLSRIKQNEPEVYKKIFTLGFPHGTMLLDVENTEIQANCVEGSVSRNDNQYSFGFNAPSYKGASGSPVFDNHGNLVGIVNAGLTDTQGFNFAIRSEFLEKLLIANKVTK